MFRDVAYNLAVREGANGSVFVICVALTIVMGIRVFDAIRASPKFWRRDLANQAAAALFVMFFGFALRAGWLWLLLKCVNDKGECSFVRDSYVMYGLFMAVALVGGLCVMRVFTNSMWPVLATAAAAVIIPAAVFFY